MLMIITSDLVEEEESAAVARRGVHIKHTHTHVSSDLVELVGEVEIVRRANLLQRAGRRHQARHLRAAALQRVHEGARGADAAGGGGLLQPTRVRNAFPKDVHPACAGQEYAREVSEHGSSR